MTYSLSPEAESELETAAAFYESQAGAPLAKAFLNEFFRAVTVLERNPGIGKAVRSGLRTHPLRRFPYSVVYRATASGILVLVVGHQHRRPHYWRGRG